MGSVAGLDAGNPARSWDGSRTPLPNLLLAGAWTGRFGQTAALRSGYQAGLRAAKVGPDMA